MQKRFLNLILVGFALTLVMGCNKLTSSGYGTSDGEDEEPDPIQLMNLRFKLSWEDQDTFTDFDFDTGSDCTITEGVDAIGAAKTCAVTVPELQLFFSDIKFQIELLPKEDGTDACAIVEYQPYYYQASNADPFVPDWAPTASEDCTVAFGLLPTNCFGGPAKDIVSSFPTYTGQYFVAAGTSGNTYDVDSANTTNPDLSNRWTTNDLSVASRATTFTIGAGQGDGHVTGTMQDWGWRCLDEFSAVNYSFTLTIKEENGAVNDYDDWKPY